MQVQLVMADDDATPSNPPVAPVQQEEIEEAPLDLNVFFNGRAKRNCPGEWCALEWIVRYGIVDCLLTHML
jgi:hypothetical protein